MPFNDFLKSSITKSYTHTRPLSIFSKFTLTYNRKSMSQQKTNPHPTFPQFERSSHLIINPISNVFVTYPRAISLPWNSICTFQKIASQQISFCIRQCGLHRLAMAPSISTTMILICEPFIYLRYFPILFRFLFHSKIDSLHRRDTV